MNPMSLLSGGGLPAGGLPAGGAATSTSGDARGSSTSGDKNISFGGNPNTPAGVLSNPIFLMAALAAVYLILKK